MVQGRAVQTHDFASIRGICDRATAVPLRRLDPAPTAHGVADVVAHFGFIQWYGNRKDKFICQFYFITFIFCNYYVALLPEVPDPADEKSNR